MLLVRRAQYKQERVSSGSAVPSRGHGATPSNKDGEMHLKITLKFDVVDTKRIQP